MHVLLRVNKGYLHLGEWEGVFLRAKVHWLQLKAPGVPHSQGETFQVLTGQVLIGRKEVEPVNSPRTG